MKYKKIEINGTILLSISILLFGCLVSTSILYVSYGFNVIGSHISSLLPKFPIHHTLREIEDFSSIDSVLAAQPRLSYNSKAKYLLVESGDFDCPHCARFNGFQTSGKSSFEKIKTEYIERGLIDYVFIDLNSLKGPDKHIAAYCASEQRSNAFFQYKDLLYKNFDKNFDEARAISYAANLKLDTNKFSECFSSKKYQDRVSKLSEFNSNVLQIKSMPTFTIFRIENKEVIKPDGSKEIRSFYTKIDQIIGNADYDLTIKPKLDEILRL